MMLKFAVPFRQRELRLLDRAEIVVRTGEYDLAASLAIFLVIVYRCDVFDGRTAAVVPNTIEAHDGKACLILRLEGGLNVLEHCFRAKSRIVGVDDSERVDTGTVAGKPLEQRRGNVGIFVVAGTHEDVIVDARAFKQGGQHP